MIWLQLGKHNQADTDHSRLLPSAKSRQGKVSISYKHNLYNVIAKLLSIEEKEQEKQEEEKQEEKQEQEDEYEQEEDWHSAAAQTKPKERAQRTSLADYHTWYNSK